MYLYQTSIKFFVLKYENSSFFFSPTFSLISIFAANYSQLYSLPRSIFTSAFIFPSPTFSTCTLFDFLHGNLQPRFFVPRARQARLHRENGRCFFSIVTRRIRRRKRNGESVGTSILSTGDISSPRRGSRSAVVARIYDFRIGRNCHLLGKISVLREQIACHFFCTRMTCYRIYHWVIWIEFVGKNASTVKIIAIVHQVICEGHECQIGILWVWVIHMILQSIYLCKQ